MRINNEEIAKPEDFPKECDLCGAIMRNELEANNPEPLLSSEHSCCETCNSTKVIPSRMLDNDKIAQGDSAELEKLQRFLGVWRAPIRESLPAVVTYMVEQGINTGITAIDGVLDHGEVQSLIRACELPSLESARRAKRSIRAKVTSRRNRKK
jgi:hypothetical protein